MSIILGIDPGSRITGYGIIKVQGQQINYCASGCIRLKAGLLIERIAQIVDGLTEIISRYMPEMIAIEEVFVHRNPRAAIKLGQARGAAIAAAAKFQLPLAEYAPRQIKQAVVGYGAATKEQVQHMVCVLLKLGQAPQSDAADALAVALCHAQTQGNLPQNSLLTKRRRRRRFTLADLS